MKKIGATETIGILANLGVLVGIVLLAYELRENRLMVQAQTRDSVAQSLATLLHAEALSGDMLDITDRAFSGESLDSVEQRRFALNWGAYFRLWENMHYQYRIGLFSESEIAAEEQSWKRLFANDALRELWCSRRTEHSLEFRETIDGLLGEAQCE